MGRPDLWDDADAAKALTAEYANVRDDLATYDGLASLLDDAEVLHELAREEDDESQEPEIADGDRRRSSSGLDQLDLRSLFTGEHDEADCIVQINAKDGGVDAQDWSEMLLRMYERWAERRGFDFGVNGVSEGTEAGILSAEFTFAGPLRLRPDDERAGHPPPGADQPVRQPGPPPDELRRRAGVAGDGRRRRRRSTTPTSAWRCSGRRAPVASTSTRRRRRCA